MKAEKICPETGAASTISAAEAVSCVRRKAAIAPDTDALEDEVDEKAGRQVMRMPESPFIRRKPGDGKSESAETAPALKKKYSGKDDAGFYEIDEDACTFKYRADWYFDFGTVIPAASQAAYMASAKSQVESNWSGKYKLVSGRKGCACDKNGFSVEVKLNTFNEPRKGRHGYTVHVQNTDLRSTTYPPISTINMNEMADAPQNKGYKNDQDVMAHEFGHTLGLEDEYTWWAALFGVPGSDDLSSIMNSGRDVKPWHYQHFADILNLEVNRCSFYPEGSGKSASLSEPVAQLGITTGAFFNQAKPGFSKAEFIIGLHTDTRVSNDAVLGLFYPTIGLDTYWNATTKRISIGPSAGLKLNRLAHPLYLDMKTGVLFSPGDDKSNAQLNIPFSVVLGLRGRGFNAGVDYTALVDVLNGGKYSHIIGINLQVDM